MVAWTAASPAEREAVAWGAAIVGGVGVVLLAGGLLLRLTAAVTIGLGIAGLVYGGVLAVEQPPLDRAAPVVAAALFVAAELAWWSLELRDRVAAEAGSQLQHLAFVLGLAICALALSFGLLALVDVVRLDGLAVVVLGAAAAVALGLLALPRRRAANEA